MAVGGYRERFFREPVDSELKDVMEVERARPLHAEYQRCDKAQTVMLVESGLVPAGAAAAILETLLNLDGDQLGPRRTEAGGGAHAGEQIVTSVLGADVGGYINLGRSTGDLTATAVRMHLKRRLIDQLDALIATRRSLSAAAGLHVDTVLAGYTHGQQTHPVTLGHIMVAYAEALGRDFDRLSAALARADRCPAGAAIMAGTSMPIDRERVARLLGFGAVDLNTYDAVLAQDVLLEGLWAVAMTAADLARISEDLMFLSSTEIAVVAIPDRFSGTSSIAAHKRNPYAPQVIKGGGAAAVGALVSGFMVEKGPTGMAIQDRAYTLKALWSGIDDLERHLRWTSQIVDGLEVDADTARRLVETHWATTTDVAALLVDAHDLPWRTAHQIVGTFVRELRARGAGPADARPEDLADAATAVIGAPISVSAADLRDALSAGAFVRRRAFPGGPAPAAVETHVRALDEILERDRATADTERQRMQEADDMLDSAVRACIQAGGPSGGA